MLVYKLVKFEKGLVFQVLWQEPDQTYNYTADLAHFQASNGLKMRTYNHPSLDGTYVNLRGHTKDEDRRVSVFMLSSNELRDQMYAKVTAALQEWAAGGGFMRAGRAALAEPSQVGTIPETPDLQDLRLAMPDGQYEHIKAAVLVRNGGAEPEVFKDDENLPIDQRFLLLQIHFAKETERLSLLAKAMAPSAASV